MLTRPSPGPVDGWSEVLKVAHRVRTAGVTDLVTEHRVENVLALRRLSKVRYHGLQSRCFDEGRPRLCCRNE